MPAMTAEIDENQRPSFFRWFRCQCQKIRLGNDRLFIIAPMIAMGSSLSEIVVVFAITGFTNLDMIAVSSVSLCLLLAFATLLFIRFDRLTLLAYLMLCVSFLSSSTFLMISYENQQNKESNNLLQSSSSRSQYLDTNEFEILDTNHVPINTSRHGKKLFDLMRAETELRWIHQIQSTNKCCGFWNYTDWADPSRFQDSNNKSYVYITEPITSPPRWVTSCCDRNLSRDNTKCRSDSVYDNWKDVMQYLFLEGCGSLLDDGLDKVQHEMLKTSMSLIFWDFFILIDVVIFTIWRKIRSQSLDCQRNGSIRDGGTEEDDVFT